MPQEFHEPPFSWNAIKNLSVGARNQAYVRAAEADIHRDLHTSLNGYAPALSVSVDADVLGSELVVSVRGASGVVDVSVPVSVIRTAVENRVAPVTLLACAVGHMSARAEALDGSWLPKPVGRGTGPGPELMDVYRRMSRMTKAAHRLEWAIRHGHDVVLTGSHGSGKTATVARRAQACRDEGWGVIWLNLVDPADGVESIFRTLLITPHADRYLLVVEGVQANSAVFPSIRACVAELRRVYGLTVTLVATVWPSLVSKVPTLFSGLQRISASGPELVGMLLSESPLSQAERRYVRTLAGGDAHLVEAALSYYARRHRVPDEAALQDVYTGNVTEAGQQQAMYWFACLNLLDIDVPARLARSRFPHVIDELLTRRLIHVDDTSLTIGHRGAARLVLAHALHHWRAAERWGPANAIVWERLQDDDAAMEAMLERMDLVGLSADPWLSGETRFLLSTWETRGRLGRRLKKGCLEDDTWNDCIGAAVFAAQAFEELKDAPSWRLTARYVRSRFRYDYSLALPEPDGDVTKDFRDFPEIVEAMRAEDKADQAWRHGWESAASIEEDQFYRTWVLGLQLGFEGTALEAEPGRLEHLIAIAEARQDPAGFFYPGRVPWVTARVVLGLCLAGETYESSEVVRLACDWLRLPRSDGGAFVGWWDSGTGKWNTPEMTTAMCLAALHRAGAPTAQVAPPAMAWLKSRRAWWTRPDYEIDLALVLEVMLLNNEPLSEISPDVAALLNWATTATNRGIPVPTAAVPEDNLRVPFVTAQLTAIVRVTFAREFSALVTELIDRSNVSAAGAPPAPAESVLTPAGPHPPPATVVVAPTDDSVVLGAALLDEWRQAWQVLRQRLAGDIRDRDQILQRQPGAKPVADRRNALDAELQRCRKLAGELGEITLRTVLLELDRAGRLTCGAEWPEPRWPDDPAAGGGAATGQARETGG